MLLRDAFVVAYWKTIDQVPLEIRERHLTLPRKYGLRWQGMIDKGQACGEIRRDLDAHVPRLLLIGSTSYALDWFRAGTGFTRKGTESRCRKIMPLTGETARGVGLIRRDA